MLRIFELYLSTGSKTLSKDVCLFNLIPEDPTDQYIGSELGNPIDEFEKLSLSKLQFSIKQSKIKFEKSLFI